MAREMDRPRKPRVEETEKGSSDKARAMTPDRKDEKMLAGVENTGISGKEVEKWVTGRGRHVSSGDSVESRASSVEEELERHSEIPAMRAERGRR